MHSLFRSDAPDVHYPDTACTCPAGPVYDFTLREFRNGNPLHVYRYCKRCGTRAQSPVKRESIPFEKWRELLVARGREVRE